MFPETHTHRHTHTEPPWPSVALPKGSLSTLTHLLWFWADTLAPVQVISGHVTHELLPGGGAVEDRSS